MTFVDASSLKLSPICCPHTPVDQSREGPEKIREHVHAPDRSRHYRSLQSHITVMGAKAEAAATQAAARTVRNMVDAKNRDAI